MIKLTANNNNTWPNILVPLYEFLSVKKMLVLHTYTNTRFHNNILDKYCIVGYKTKAYYFTNQTFIAIEVKGLTKYCKALET